MSFAYFEFNQEFVLGFRNGLTGNKISDCPATKKSGDMEQLNEILILLLQPIIYVSGVSKDRTIKALTSNLGEFF